MAEAGLAAKLEKVTERLAAEAVNAERTGADLIAHYRRFMAVTMIRSARSQGVVAGSAIQRLRYSLSRRPFLPPWERLPRQTGVLTVIETVRGRPTRTAGKASLVHRMWQPKMLSRRSVGRLR